MNKVDFGRLRTSWRCEEGGGRGNTGFSGLVPEWMVVAFLRRSTRRDPDLGTERGGNEGANVYLALTLTDLSTEYCNDSVR